MNSISDTIRQAFDEPLRLPVKVTPDGFRIQGSLLTELRGKITKITLSRKLFHHGALLCYSRDGVYGTEAQLCSLCYESACQPRLRIQLTARDTVYLLELPSSSARNLLAIDDQASRSKAHLRNLTLRLTVTPQGHWGEVRFEIVPDAVPT